MFCKADRLRFRRVKAHPVSLRGFIRVGAQAVAKRHFIFATGRFQDSIKIHRLVQLNVIPGGLKVNFRTFRIKQVIEDFHQLLILRNLRKHQTDQAVADDEIVDMSDFRQLAVADIQHLADNRKRVAAFLGDIAQVQERDQRARIRLLDIIIRSLDNSIR